MCVDAIASASIVQNGAGVETSRSRVLTSSAFSTFLKTQQGERKSEYEVKSIIEVRTLLTFPVKNVTLYIFSCLFGGSLVWFENETKSDGNLIIFLANAMEIP